ncbi:hypothetical protein H4R33_005461 [Dimargaris cristalligena]|uniref:Uncharacterized protein n=1 Tax=Dimargaris cristalligena TaxID=215637 RepID=A0A4P9ZJN7_9FUNG|nr:hypothetical protein H4R33_005461 [Dimargaris cristalligena]RKP33283.1 hypothetical protein BJ085DRAFT_29500 [Dimargaris cristalligena]|eukprot:RKP33283.1 hypothetical protein BJ085DRAFT_29500 [Dimargaris cristalligena]
MTAELDCSACSGCGPRNPSSDFSQSSQLVAAVDVLLAEGDRVYVNGQQEWPSLPVTAANQTTLGNEHHLATPVHAWVDEICQKLADAHYSSYMALTQLAHAVMKQPGSAITASDPSEVNPSGWPAFRLLIKQCTRLRLTGPLLAWAMDYVKYDPDRFIELVTQCDPTMVEHVNGQAELYELVNGLPLGQCGRIRPRTKPPPAKDQGLPGTNAK